MGTDNYAELERNLADLFRTYSKILLLGIGENRMGDDGAGPYITFELSLRINNPLVKCINGGIVPEERLDEIITFQPDCILIIDVIGTKSPPGTVDLFDEKVMLNYLPISSHSMPLPVFVDRMYRGLPDVNIKLLGICPYDLTFKEYYELYKEDVYSLEDKDENLDIPFYSFHLSANMVEVSDKVTMILENLLSDKI